MELDRDQRELVIRTWRLVTILLAALSMGTVLCHLLEMPAKLTYTGALWLTLLQTLYPPLFGKVGAFFEVGAIVSAWILAYLLRLRRSAFIWTVAGALCLLVAHAAFWLWIAPVNSTMAPLTPDTLPADWMTLRDQWEFTHTARAILQFAGLAALICSVLVEVPPGGAGARRKR